MFILTAIVIGVEQETRQRRPRRLYRGKTGQLLLEHTILDRVKQYVKVEIALGVKRRSMNAHILLVYLWKR